MKSFKACSKYVPDADLGVCFWCRWSESNHADPEKMVFEMNYWETLYRSGAGSDRLTDEPN